MANLAHSTVTIQTDQTEDFSNVHNFVKNFVWDPIQRKYCSESRGVSFAPKKVRKRAKQKIKVSGCAAWYSSWKKSTINYPALSGTTVEYC